jgi:hypothetical protein
LILVFADYLDPAAFLGVVEELGGDRHPDEWTDGRLCKYGGVVWVTVDPEFLPELEVEHWLEYEQKLGVPARSLVEFLLSSDSASHAVAMDIINAAAKRWHLIVDDDHGGLHTVEELRQRPVDRLPFGGKP